MALKAKSSSAGIKMMESGNKRMEVRRVGVWSMTRLYMIMMAVIGLILGIIVAILALTLGVAYDTGMGSYGWLAVIIYPVIYGVIGLIAGALGAWLYNVFAGWVGGVEFEYK